MTNKELAKILIEHFYDDEEDEIDLSYLNLVNYRVNLSNLIADSVDLASIRACHIDNSYQEADEWIDNSNQRSYEIDNADQESETKIDNARQKSIKKIT